MADSVSFEAPHYLPTVLHCPTIMRQLRKFRSKAPGRNNNVAIDAILFGFSALDNGEDSGWGITPRLTPIHVPDTPPSSTSGQSVAHAGILAVLPGAEQSQSMQLSAVETPLSIINHRVNANLAARGPISRTYEFAEAQRWPGGGCRPLMFAYWGRHGALSQLSLQLAHVIAARNDLRCTVSVSKQNEHFSKFDFLHDDLFAVDTYNKQYQAFMRYMRLRNLRKNLTQRLLRDNTRAFVSLMPHIWSPLTASAIRRAGVRHIAIIHDAGCHPGDRCGLVNAWLLREAAAADHVITLSEAVAQRLIDARGIPEKNISVLFLPDLNYGAQLGSGESQGGPLRVLFLGRILSYKGLDLFVDAMARLRNEGVQVQIGVFGEGKINPTTVATLSALGAEVENRWLQHDEFSGILSRYDIVAASHTEASQSGVIATAFGAGLPVVATPVGGLVEQVAHNVTGVIARSATASAFADAVRTLAESRGLLPRLRREISALREERSIERFVDKICDIALCQQN
jgi:glycosyltransferase involved in cell wall biosynthesis